jgi:hypothetical protein
MPDPYERHSRNSWEWGPSPARGQARAAAADQDVVPERRPPAKKDRDLCKAAHWKGPHQPELRKHPQLYYRHSKCHWTPGWAAREPHWACAHEEACTGCGKVLRVWVKKEECPDFRPVTEAERAEIMQAIEQWDARRARRRSAIDGPQGYRKRKA